MRFAHILPFAAVSTALVIPSEQVLEEIEIEANHRATGWYDTLQAEKDKWTSKVEEVTEEVTDQTFWEHIKDTTHNAVDDALNYANAAAQTVRGEYAEVSSEAAAWLEGAAGAADDVYEAFGDHHHKPGHGKPHHPPHHGQPNLTVYELIAGSKYTTKLAKLISEYDDLVEALNSTKANYTVFAPTDKAFEKIPDHAPKPSKETLKKILSYHVVPDAYPAGRVLVTHTVPTLLKSDSLGSKPEAQRLSLQLGLRGLTVNFYSRIIAVNIFGTNGVIHGVDSILVPPPSVVEAIDLFPGEFSTLELGLGKTGLLEKLNTTDHAGGTFFAPSNFAFQKLGPRVNAFLFSKFGQKYLKALLEYHVVPDNTLYSDAYYKAESKDDQSQNVPKGRFHLDLPTLLDDRSLAIDIARYGGYISIRVNAYARVTVQDGVAEDGVLHIVSDVIVPPKNIGGPGKAQLEHWDGETEMTVDELIERLSPLMPKADL